MPYKYFSNSFHNHSIDYLIVYFLVVVFFFALVTFNYTVVNGGLNWIFYFVVVFLLYLAVHGAPSHSYLTFILKHQILQQVRIILNVIRLILIKNQCFTLRVAMYFLQQLFELVLIEFHIFH